MWNVTPKTGKNAAVHTHVVNNEVAPLPRLQIPPIVHPIYPKPTTLLTIFAEDACMARFGKVALRYVDFRGLTY